MVFKVLIVMLLLVTLSIFLLINGASLASQQEQASHDLAHKDLSGYVAMPRKLLLNQEVKGINDKDLVYNEPFSDESGKGGEAAAEHEKMHGGYDLTPLFNKDYSGVRKRRPVHNKSFPATNTFP